jgi:hypothetical protein
MEDRTHQYAIRLQACEPITLILRQIPHALGHEGEYEDNPEGVFELVSEQGIEDPHNSTGSKSGSNTGPTE